MSYVNISPASHFQKILSFPQYFKVLFYFLEIRIEIPGKTKI